MKEVMLTTIDNPYNPFTQFEEWNSFDQSKGYNTSSFLARIVHSSLSLSQPDQDVSIENGIDEIIKYNTLGIYRKVTREDY